MPRMSRASVPLVGLFAIGAACSGVIPPDPYLGTVDPNATTPQTPFNALFGYPTPPSTGNPLAACLQPRRGFGGASGLDTVTWVYLGGLSGTQIDISNSSDPT